MVGVIFLTTVSGPCHLAISLLEENGPSDLVKTIRLSGKSSGQEPYKSLKAENLPCWHKEEMVATLSL